MFNKNKQFLKQELARYEELMKNEVPGTEEYEQLRKSYQEVYRELYSKKNPWEITMDVLRLFVPVGASIWTAVYAYHKNQELESKDGDAWRISQKLNR